MVVNCFVLPLLMGLAAAGPPAAPREQQVRVRVAPVASLGDVAAALRKAAAASGVKGACALVWGDLGTPPGPAWPVRLEWGAGGHIDGWLVPAEAGMAPIKTLEIRQVGVLEYRGGRLRVSHPSGPGSSVVPVDGEETPETRRERRETFGLVAVSDRSVRQPAVPALRALAQAPRFFRFLLWELGDGAQRRKGGQGRAGTMRGRPPQAASLPLLAGPSAKASSIV